MKLLWEKWKPIRGCILAFFVSMACMLFVYAVAVAPKLGQLRVAADAQQVHSAQVLQIYYWCIAATCIFVLVLGYYLLFVRKAKPQTLFVLAALVLGCSYMFVSTPYSTQDGIVHIPNTFARASAWQNGQWDISDNKAVIRAEEVQQVFNDEKANSHKYALIGDTLFDRQTQQGTQEIEIIPVGKMYQFIPQTVGVLLARWLALAQAPSLLLGQLFGLLFYVLCGWFAIKICPFADTFAIIALFPMVLHMEGTFSYDSFINATALLFLALALALLYGDKKFPLWQWGLLLCLTVLLVPAKVIYAPMVVLVIYGALRQGGFKNKKVLLFAAAVLLTGILVGVKLFGGAIVGMLQSTGTHVGPWNEEAYSLGLLLTMPRELVRLLCTTFFDHFGAMLLEAAGGLYTTPLPATLTVACFALAFCSVCTKQPLLQSIKPMDRVMFAAVALCTWLAGYIVALTWTSVGSYYILGMQGRYLIPVLPLLILPLSGILQRKTADNRVMLYGICCVNVCAILYIFNTCLA